MNILIQNRKEVIPWNKNKSQGQKKPFNSYQIEALKGILANKEATKELALFSFGIDSMLLANDLAMPPFFKTLSPSPN